MPGRVDLTEFVTGFLLEAEEHLHAVNQNLVAVSTALETGRPEPRAVRELFRSFHTIKGLAAMVGAEPVVDIAHELEGILRVAERTGGRLSEEVLDLLLRGTRAMEERVRAIAKEGIAGAPAAPKQLLEALALAQSTEPQTAAPADVALSLSEELARSLSAAEREQMVEAVHAGRRVVLLEFQPSPERVAQGLNITAVRERLAALGDLVKVVPRADATAPTGIAFCLLVATTADDAALVEAVGGTRDTIRPVSVATCDQTAEPTPWMPEPEPAGEWLPSDHSIRVDVRRLDEALEQLSALVVSGFKMARAAANLTSRGVDTRELNAIIAENTRQLRRLRAAVTKARMVPLAELLQRLPLVVRGLTKDTDKAASITIRAGSAEVDKAVADRIFPAVVHLVRNAVDHAIEPREERRRAAKPEIGTLSICCDDSSGTSLMLTVTDDGRGIDPADVARKLGRPPARDEEELLQQIATPGLSTRDDITLASGRGLGVDIAKRTVEALGGVLALKTEEGRGTTFTIRVPVSITIVDVFSFLSGGQVFVAPVAMVDEIVDIEPSQLVKAPAPMHTGPASRLVERRGEAIPFLSLDEVLQQRSTRAIPPKALVVNQSRGAIAFGVDRMLGQQEVVVRPLDDALVRVPGVSGATDLGDGKPTLVLDLGTLGAAIKHDAAMPT
jgi:two-component system, chemotaxis family, sensor kinase CheA